MTGSGPRFNERTYLTTRREIDTMLANARKKGTLNTLFWFVECKYPGHRSSTGRANLQAANYPVSQTPVIPVGDCPEESKHFAEILLSLFQNGSRGLGIEFALALTNRKTLGDDPDWYVFGDQVWDNICVLCGAIVQDGNASLDMCLDCVAREFSVVRMTPGGLQE